MENCYGNNKVRSFMKKLNNSHLYTTSFFRFPPHFFRSSYYHTGLFPGVEVCMKTSIKMSAVESILIFTKSNIFRIATN